jgi:hypothetical protein
VTYPVRPFTVGDRVWYVIDGLGAVPPIWLSVVVVRVTTTRIGVRSAEGKRPRYVAPSRLTTAPPPPEVTVLVFAPRGSEVLH